MINTKTKKINGGTGHPEPVKRSIQHDYEGSLMCMLNLFIML